MIPDCMHQVKRRVSLRYFYTKNAKTIYLFLKAQRCLCGTIFQENVWFQKISITPPRRELEVPEGWGGGGGQRPRKFRRGGGVVSEFKFPDGQVQCHANLFQNRFLPTLKIFYIEKIAA